MTQTESGKKMITMQRDIERGKNCSSFCSLAREKQLYYITASGLGSSHAFKEEAHVPLHLKSHGTVGEDEDEVEACEQRQREQREYSGENMLKNIAVLAR